MGFYFGVKQGQAYTTMRALLGCFLLFTSAFSLGLEQNLKFQRFKSKYGKIYQNAEEEKLRFNIFLENIEKAEAHNKIASTYTKGVNEWSDMTQAEWEATPQCGVDSTTSGHVCQGGPGNDQLHVCGMCGMLFETSFPLGAHKL